MELVAVFSDSNRQNKSLMEYCSKHGIILKTVTSDDEIMEYPLKPDYFMMYDTAIIIHRPLLTRFDFYNFHPGDLMTNRGRNPLVWNILSGDDCACMSLYKISEAIDEGELIGTFQSVITEDDTINTIARKLEGGLPRLLGLLAAYRQGLSMGRIMKGGLYRPRVTPRDYTIDLEVDTLKTIKQKINSQKTYSGALLPYKGKMYRCTGFETNASTPTASEYFEVEIGGTPCRFLIGPETKISRPGLAIGGSK